MHTQCNLTDLTFEGLGRREVIGKFDGGRMSSDGGSVLLRPSNIDASYGSVAELKLIVARVRECWPDTRIVVRGDSGFCREELMAWCEDHGVDFVLGLARNPRLQRSLER